MKKNILFVILDKYSEWEAGYLAPLILALGGEKYDIKTVSLTKDPIKSLGGFTVVPDYDIESAPDDFAAVVLVGGMSWRVKEAEQVKTLVEKTLNKKKILAAICDATVFLGKMGVLNEVKHTSNDINDLKDWAKEAYCGEDNYLMEPAVRDNNVITANGTATLEFMREVLLALEVANEEKINAWYDFYKLGCYKAATPEL